VAVFVGAASAVVSVVHALFAAHALFAVAVSVVGLPFAVALSVAEVVFVCALYVAPVPFAVALSVVRASPVSGASASAAFVVGVIAGSGASTTALRTWHTATTTVAAAPG